MIATPPPLPLHHHHHHNLVTILTVVHHHHHHNQHHHLYLHHHNVQIQIVDVTRTMSITMIRAIKMMMIKQARITMKYILQYFK